MSTDVNLVQHLYLTGVRPNGKEIGVGAYGRVFEVEYCGTVFAAKEVHQILAQGEFFFWAHFVLENFSDLVNLPFFFVLRKVMFLNDKLFLIVGSSSRGVSRS